MTTDLIDRIKDNLNKKSKQVQELGHEAKVLRQRVAGLESMLSQKVNILVQREQNIEQLTKESYNQKSAIGSCYRERAHLLALLAKVLPSAICQDSTAKEDDPFGTVLFLLPLEGTPE